MIGSLGDSGKRNSSDARASQTSETSSGKQKRRKIPSDFRDNNDNISSNSGKGSKKDGFCSDRSSNSRSDGSSSSSRSISRKSHETKSTQSTVFPLFLFSPLAMVYFDSSFLLFFLSLNSSLPLSLPVCCSQAVSSVISIWAGFLTTRDCVNASACCRGWNKGLARFRKTKLEFLEHHPCPAEVQYLTIGKHFTDARICVDAKKIPPNVRWMKLGSMYSGKLDPQILTMNWPSRLETLHLGSEIWPVTCADLPSTLTALRWQDPPDHLVLRDLPRGLRELTLKTHSWKSLANLPPNLMKLSLGNSDFNEPVAGVLPSTLQTLKLGGNFNCPVNSLPPRLQVCKLGGDCFNQSIDELPASVRELKLGDAFSRRVGKWPACLARLHCSSQHWEAVDSAPLPPLQSLTISSAILPPLPSSLTELTVLSHDSQVRQLHSLPPQLVSLKTREVELLVEAWPEGLTSLDFDRYGLRCVPQSWPSGLVSLKIEERVENYPELPLFPHTLLTLSIGGEIKLTLPPKLMSLTWFSYPSATELLVLPHSLTSLDISGEVPPLSLPPCLEVLEIVGNFNEPLALPLSLYKLEIAGNWNQPLCLVSEDMIKVDLRSSNFNAEITGPLPRVLWLPHCFKQDIPWPLPPHVRNVRIGKCHPRAKELKLLDPRVTIM